MSKPLAMIQWGKYGGRFFVGISAGGSTKIRYFATKEGARKAAADLAKSMRRVGAKVSLTKVG